MYKQLNEEDTENNQVKVGFIKNDMTQKKFYQKKTLSKKDIENASKDDVGKIEKMNKIAEQYMNKILSNLFFALIMKIKEEVV